MKLKVLVGSGGRIMSLTLPFIVVGLVANLLWPGVFAVSRNTGVLVVGIFLLVIGVPVWLSSVALVLINVPKKKLVTTGPFAVIAHPMYTGVALLVFPGLGLLFGTWLGIGLGIVLYISSRIFSPEEDRILAKVFPDDYPAYRERILIPWL